ncbi:MAG: HAMP domain-containing histidine kinase [Ktedonobacteraceae bacterium]|nr:HAMP domain-containing histidine kinase [Ktedonobacteraceae bacterium]
MQTEIHNHQPHTGPLHKHPRSQGGWDQHTAVLPSWIYSPWFGYLSSFFLVVILVIFEKIDQLLPSTPLFIAAPFGIASILVALLWGMGPALFATVLGLAAIAIFLSPGIFTPNIGMDIIIAGPFAVLQIAAIMIVIWLEHTRQRLLAAHKITQKYEEELETANQALFQANEELERANYLKDYVITRASHELRTPLTAILGRTQLLLTRLNRYRETTENWSTLHKHLEIVEVRAQHLRALINNLFDLSSIRSGAAPLQMAPCELGCLCRNIVEEQRIISGRSIDLELPARSIVLQADDKRLSQVLLNLVSNAVQYSPEETTIHMGMRVRDTHVTLYVHNNRPVLTQEQLSHLFEPMYRTYEVEYSPIPGWGLGLTISKEIVERHRGQIWAESSPEKGTTFFVKLPIQADTENE